MFTIRLRTVIITLFIATSSIAAEHCELRVTRTACPNKEELSFRKCAGQAACDAHFNQVSQSDCIELAKRSCINPRPDITKSKQIVVRFDGNTLTDENGESDFCQSYKKRAQEFDQC